MVIPLSGPHKGLKVPVGGLLSTDIQDTSDINYVGESLFLFAFYFFGRFGSLPIVCTSCSATR